MHAHMYALYSGLRTFVWSEQADISEMLDILLAAHGSLCYLLVILMHLQQLVRLATLELCTPGPVHAFSCLVSLDQVFFQALRCLHAAAWCVLQ